MVSGTKRNVAVAAVLFAALLITGTARAGDFPEKSRVDAFKSRLKKNGFVWQEGQVWFPSILDMCCTCQLPSCYSNNRSSRYGFFALPPAPHQAPSVKNPYAEWFTENASLPPGWSFAWRLRPDEAVVFLGKTPPQVEYFGFTAYLYDRYVAGMGPLADCTWNNNGTLDHKAQPASAQNRFPVFASLGDTINDETIHLADGRQSPFEKNVVVVMAADRRVLHEVEMTLKAAGYPEKSMNFLPLAPALARLGLDSQDDSFMVTLRVAPSPGEDVDEYYTQAMTLLRVTPAKPVRVSQLDPVPPPKLRVRGTGKTEASLEAEVDALGQAIVAHYAGIGYKAMPVKMATLPDGYNCISNMQNCLADNRDTIYISPAYDIISGQLLPGQPPLTLAPNEFLVVYGVQHQLVNKASYSNISIMGWVKKAAPAVVTNRDMADSAEEYLPGADPVLYAYQVARTDGCLSQHCIALGTSCDSGIAADEAVAPIFRAYMEPGTKIGPYWGEVILDRVLKFTPAQ
jgi:hypothetical protein